MYISVYYLLLLFYGIKMIMGTAVAQWLIINNNGRQRNNI